MQTFTVYCHANNTNGKRYVGITSQNVKRRWCRGTSYSYNKHFSRAIAKYGWRGFTHYLLADNLTKDEACAMEQEFIEKWKCTDREYGYNSTSGGEHFKHSDDVKKIISETSKGRKHTEASKAKISKAHKGRKHSAETRKKVSLGHLGQIPCNRKRVMCVETGVIYSHAKEGWVDNGGDPNSYAFQHIRDCCRGERPVCLGLHWRYVSDGGD